MWGKFVSLSEGSPPRRSTLPAQTNVQLFTNKWAEFQKDYESFLKGQSFTLDHFKQLLVDLTEGLTNEDVHVVNLQDTLSKPDLKNPCLEFIIPDKLEVLIAYA